MTRKEDFEKSKLMLLIRKFNKNEIKSLRLWLCSPIHNSSENVINLFDILRKYHKNGRRIDAFTVMRQTNILAKGSTRKSICEKHLQDLRKVMSLLTIQIQKFIIWQQNESDIIGNNRLLMDWLLEKQLFNQAKITLKETQKMHESALIQGVDYTLDAYKLSEMNYYISSLLKNRDSTGSLSSALNALEQSCLSQLLRYYCAASNSRRISKLDNFPLMEVIKRFMAENEEDWSFTVEMYYLSLKVLEEEKREDFVALKVKLFESLQVIDPYELKTFFNIIINFCNRKFKQGLEEFMFEKFEIYKVGLETQCWSTGVYFSEHQFIQIVKTALYLNELDWLSTFFETHCSLLNPMVKEDFIHYYHSLTSIQLKQFETAQSHLNDISRNQDFAYHMESKVLLLKIYYDSEELTIENLDKHPISHLIESIRKYSSRTGNKKMAESFRLQYSNFAGYFKRILEFKKKAVSKEKFSETKLISLQTDLGKLNPLIERKWLREKIIELQLDT